jgi:hypothetical protein
MVGDRHLEEHPVERGTLAELSCCIWALFIIPGICPGSSGRLARVPASKSGFAGFRFPPEVIIVAV